MTTYWLLGRADCPDDIMPMGDTPEEVTSGGHEPELPGEIQPYAFCGGGQTGVEVRRDSALRLLWGRTNRCRGKERFSPTPSVGEDKQV